MRIQVVGNSSHVEWAAGYELPDAFCLTVQAHADPHPQHLLPGQQGRDGVSYANEAVVLKDRLERDLAASWRDKAVVLLVPETPRDESVLAGPAYQRSTAAGHIELLWRERNTTARQLATFVPSADSPKSLSASAAAATEDP